MSQYFPYTKIQPRYGGSAVTLDLWEGSHVASSCATATWSCWTAVPQRMIYVSKSINGNIIMTWWKGFGGLSALLPHLSAAFYLTLWTSCWYALADALYLFCFVFFFFLGSKTSYFILKENTFTLYCKFLYLPPQFNL